MEKLQHFLEACLNWKLEITEQISSVKILKNRHEFNFNKCNKCNKFQKSKKNKKQTNKLILQEANNKHYAKEEIASFHQLKNNCQMAYWHMSSK